MWVKKSRLVPIKTPDTLRPSDRHLTSQCPCVSSDAKIGQENGLISKVGGKNDVFCTHWYLSIDILENTIVLLYLSSQLHVTGPLEHLRTPWQLEKGTFGGRRLLLSYQPAHYSDKWYLLVGLRLFIRDFVTFTINAVWITACGPSS